MMIQIRFAAVSIALSISMAFAQAPAAPPPSAATPVQAKRVPAASNQSPPNQVPSVVQKYDFGGQLRVLQDPTAMDLQTTVPLMPSLGSKSDTDGKAPTGFQPRTDLPLNSTALEAVRMSDSWRTGQNTPAAGPDGRVCMPTVQGFPS